MSGRAAATPRRLPSRRARGRAGLVTLEWLLVVSVSALLAGLVVAFVHRNLDRGVTQVAEASHTEPGPQRDLRRAQALADELSQRVEFEALRYDEYDYRFQDPAFWGRHFTTRCERIREVFADLAAEGVTVQVRADFRADEVTLLTQQLEAADLGETPWTFGHRPLKSRTRSPGKSGVSAFTVCQVILRHAPGYGVSS